MSGAHGNDESEREDGEHYSQYLDEDPNNQATNSDAEIVDGNEDVDTTNGDMPVTSGADRKSVV